LKPLRISHGQAVGLCKSFNLYDFAVLCAGKNSRRQECHSEIIELTQLEMSSLGLLKQGKCSVIISRATGLRLTVI